MVVVGDREAAALSEGGEKLAIAAAVAPATERVSELDGGALKPLARDHGHRLVTVQLAKAELAEDSAQHLLGDVLGEADDVERERVIWADGVARVARRTRGHCDLGDAASRVGSRALRLAMAVLGRWR